MHIMIDLESYGGRDDAQILQISAVAFELNGTVLEPHELLQYDDRWFDAVIEPYYASRDASNEAFWKSEEAAPAAARIAERPQVPIDTALQGFTAFAGRWLGQRGRVWAKPPQFDLRILRAAYSESAWSGTREAPWHRAQEADLSTLLWIARKVPRINFKAPDMAGAGLVKHYALHDAVHQAVIAQAAFRSLLYSAAQRGSDRDAMLAAQQQEIEDAIPSTKGSPSQG